MRCDAVQARLMRFVDGRLPTVQARRIDGHLDVCPRCRRRYAEEVELCAAFREVASAAASSELVGDVLRRLEAAEPAPRAERPQPPSLAPPALLWGLLGTGALAMALSWQPAAETLAGLSSRGASDLLGAASAGLGGAVAGLVSMWNGVVAGLVGSLAELAGSGATTASTLWDDHDVVIAVLTAAAALACVALVRAASRRTLEEKQP